MEILENLFKGGNLKKFFLAFLLFCSTVFPQMVVDSTKISVDWCSRYVWHASHDGSNVLSPSISAWSGKAMFKLNYSTNIGVDASAYYNLNVGLISITPGYTLYARETWELYNEISVETILSISKFSVGNKLYILEGVYDKVYARYSGEYNWVVIGMSFSNSFYNKKFRSYDKSSVSSIYIGYGFNYEPIKHVMVRPVVELYKFNEKYVGNDALVNFGIGITYSF